MYKIELHFKDGTRKEISHPYLPTILYWQNPEKNRYPMDFVDLTPDNIINKGGFTDNFIGVPNVKKIEFKYIATGINYSIYEEI